MEIKKLQELHFKNKKKVLKPLPKSIKCANVNCCSPGGNLVTKNVNAYSQYAICSGCEHFKCARVKDIRKANIINDSEKFVCTKCFASNSRGIVLNKLIAPLKNVPIEI